MADYFLDVNAAGGGNGSLETPWNNFEDANTTAVLGDTVSVADGTYILVTNLSQGSSPLWFAANGLGGVIVQAPNVTNHILRYGGVDELSRWTNFILDGTGVDASCVNIDNNANLKELIGNRFINFTGQAITSTNPSTGLLVQGNDCISTGARFVDLGATTAILDANTLSGNYTSIIRVQTSGDIEFINNIATAINRTSDSPLLLVRGQTRAILNGNSITLASIAGTSPIIEARDTATVEANNNTVDTTAFSTNSQSIDIRNTDGLTAMSVVVDGNNILSNSPQFQGIMVGRDTPDAGDGLINGAVISNNSYSGPKDRGATANGIHGFELGYNTGELFNNVSSGCTLGYVIKGTLDFLFAGGLHHCESINSQGNSSIRIKGVKNCPVNNCTTVVNDGLLGGEGLLYAQDNSESADTPATGTKFYNQIITSNYTGGANLVIQADLASSTGFDSDGNCYFLPNSTIQFNVNGVAYNSLADFKAAGFDAASVEGDPLFVNEAGGDFNLTAGSPALGIGVKYWGNGPRPTSKNGEPVPDTGIDAGANQSTLNVGHPANPAFVGL